MLSKNKEDETRNRESMFERKNYVETKTNKNKSKHNTNANNQNRCKAIENVKQ